MSMRWTIKRTDYLTTIFVTDTEDNSRAATRKIATIDGSVSPKTLEKIKDILVAEVSG